MRIRWFSHCYYLGREPELSFRILQLEICFQYGVGLHFLHTSISLLPFTIKHLKESSLSSVFIFSIQLISYLYLQSSFSSHFSKETASWCSLVTPWSRSFGSILPNLVFTAVAGTLVLLFSLNSLEILCFGDNTWFSSLFIWPLRWLLHWLPVFFSPCNKCIP